MRVCSLVSLSLAPDVWSLAALATLLIRQTGLVGYAYNESLLYID